MAMAAVRVPSLLTPDSEGLYMIRPSSRSTLRPSSASLPPRVMSEAGTTTQLRGNCTQLRGSHSQHPRDLWVLRKGQVVSTPSAFTALYTRAHGFPSGDPIAILAPSVPGSSPICRPASSSLERTPAHDHTLDPHSGGAPGMQPGSCCSSSSLLSTESSSRIGARSAKVSTVLHERSSSLHTPAHGKQRPRAKLSGNHDSRDHPSTRVPASSKHRRCGGAADLNASEDDHENRLLLYGYASTTAMPALCPGPARYGAGQASWAPANARFHQNTHKSR